MRWLKTYAVTVYGVAVLSVIIVAGMSNPQYDDGGFGFFYHFVLVPILGFMFYLPHEMLSSAGGNWEFPSREIFSAILGLFVCLGVDYFRHRRRRRRTIIS
jgi:uncharacterized membrane protein